MLKREYDNSHAEMIELLPDDLEILVTKSWCMSIISNLYQKEDYGDLLNIINEYVNAANSRKNSSGYTSSYVGIIVGDIKKIFNICGSGSFCCILPYNYEKILNDFLYLKLGDIKFMIELFSINNKNEEAFELINSINNNYIQKLALLYLKFLHNINTEKMIEDLKNSRRHVISKINSLLYF